MKTKTKFHLFEILQEMGVRKTLKENGRKKIQKAEKAATQAGMEIDI